MSTSGEAERRSWWSRNWGWVVPFGCLGLVAAGIGVAAALVFALTGALRDSWAFSEGVAMAQRHPQVVRRLGEPIRAGRWASGSISLSGSSGRADLAIPLHGPDGRARLYVKATKSDGEWHFVSATVEFASGGEPLDLLVGDPTDIVRVLPVDRGHPRGHRERPDRPGIPDREAA